MLMGLLRKRGDFMNPWLFAFLTGLIVFVLPNNRQTFLCNLWAGLVCMLFQLGISIIAQKLDLWNYLKVNSGIPGFLQFPEYLNVFFLGISFLMGMLYVQFLPVNMILQLINAAVWTFFFRMLFQIAVWNGMIDFNNWRVWMYYYIFPTNMLALAWVKNTFFGRAGKYGGYSFR